MEKSIGFRWNKLLYGSLALIALFLFQVFAGKIGWVVANLSSYDSVDPAHLFAGLSVHHFVQMLLTLVVIFGLSKLIKADFGFSLGNRKNGMRYFLLFTAIIAGIALAYHIFIYATGQPLTYSFELNRGNVLGTLGFQLFLSGPSEEVLYRVLPVTIFVYVFGQNVHVTWGVTLEVILAALLFAIAHINWTLSPFSVKLSVFQLVYAFAMGIISGVVYQKSRSILYPVLMHSISNVLMVGTGYLFAVLV